MACMAYVDLNPVRAGIAATPEESDHTSVKKRVAAAQSVGRVPEVLAKQPAALQSFAGWPRNNMPPGIPFRFTDYLELLDWTGRAIRADKRGHIDNALPEILVRLDIDPDHWLYMTQNFESSFKSLVGTMYTMRRVCSRMGMQRIPGRAACEALF